MLRVFLETTDVASKLRDNPKAYSVVVREGGQTQLLQLPKPPE